MVGNKEHDLAVAEDSEGDLIRYCKVCGAFATRRPARLPASEVAGPPLLSDLHIRVSLPKCEWADVFWAPACQSGNGEVCLSARLSVERSTGPYFGLQK